MDDVETRFPEPQPAAIDADESVPAEIPAETPAAPLLKSRFSSFWREWVKPLLIIGLVMFSFRSAVADWNDVPTGSMKPTILEGDRICINKVAYDLKFPFTTWRLVEWGDPQWGDVVVLRSPEDGKRLVKRVVALPGDIVEVRNGYLYVNGERTASVPLDPWIVNQIEPESQPDHVFFAEGFHGRQHPVMLSRAVPPSFFGPLAIPESQYFVMGDNRSNSRDSRWFGPVERSLILGRATAVALSVDPENFYRPRWERFFSSLP